MMRILTLMFTLFATPVWADYEQPAYEIVLKEEGLALRDYAPVMVVETQVSASRRDAPGDAFRRLARYIGGKNTADMDIPMTAPVGQTRVAASDEAGDGAPDGAGERWAIRFYLPRDMSLANTPPPREEGVRVLQLPAQRFAAVSFRGTQNDKKVAKNLAKLKGFIARNGYEVTGPPVYAFYDPPFVPWFLRDNEILMPVAPALVP